MNSFVSDTNIRLIAVEENNTEEDIQITALEESVFGKN